MLHRLEDKVLTKLLPDQISKFWDIIRYAIEESLPPIVGESPDKMKKILMSLLTDKSQCWVSYQNADGDRKMEGVMVTRISYDDVSDTRSLLIYCLYSYEGISQSGWKDGLKSLVKYARSKKCERIIAYTEVPGIVDFVKRIGGEAKYTFVSIPLR